MNKAVIFDGDGTLWRPIGGGKNLRPDVIYRGGKVEKNSHLRLEIVNGAYEMLSVTWSRIQDLCCFGASCARERGA